MATTGQILAGRARLALAELRRDNERLVDACDASLFDSDALLCSGLVERVERFLSIEAPRVVERIEAGDVDAAHRLAESIAGIRQAVVDEAERYGVTLSAGGVFDTFVNDVVIETGREVVAGGRSMLPYVAAGVGVVGGLWVLSKVWR